MSKSLTSKVQWIDLPRAEKLILGYLVFQLNTEAISISTGYSIRYVRRALKSLESRGILKPVDDDGVDEEAAKAVTKLIRTE